MARIGPMATINNDAPTFVHWPFGYLGNLIRHDDEGYNSDSDGDSDIPSLI